MGVFTSKAAGNKSAAGQTTWNEVGTPAAGDTAVVDHVVTWDTNSAIGTSPNDITTLAIEIQDGGSVVVAPGVVLTAKGKIEFTGFSFSGTQRFEIGEGATLRFDPSASGGTPAYELDATFVKLLLKAGAAVEAVVGHTCKIIGHNLFATGPCVDWTDYALTRVASIVLPIHTSSGVSVVGGTVVECGAFEFFTSGALAEGFVFRDNIMTDGTHADTSLFMQFTGEPAGGPVVTGNGTDKGVTISVDFGGVFVGNVVGGKWSKLAQATMTACHDNAFLGCGSTENSDGRFDDVDVLRNFFFAPVNENPHYMKLFASTRTCRVEQNVFQADGEETSGDTGDCAFLFSSGGFRNEARNNLILKATNEPLGLTSGQLITLFDADAARLSRIENNTAYGVNHGSSGIVNVAEGDVGVTGEVETFRDNIAWADTPTATCFLLSRRSGTTNGIVVAAGAVGNVVYQLGTGDNGRSYEDFGNSPGLDLWDGTEATGVDAAGAGADANQATANPDFVTPTGTLQSWCFDGGFGAATVEDARDALIAVPSRVVGLLDYLFECAKIQNPDYRTSAVNGGPRGAANFDAGRSLTELRAATAALASKYNP